MLRDSSRSSGDSHFPTIEKRVFPRDGDPLAWVHQEVHARPREASGRDQKNADLTEQIASELGS